MEGVVGAEVSQKIRAAIKAKLMEIGVYVDEELPDYVMVMVANKRSKEQMDEDLELFLGKHTSLFTQWLHSILQKLQEVTVANLGVKRKLGDDSKKKKKSKQDNDKKVLKKKIKIEPVDDVSTSQKKDDSLKASENEQIKNTKNNTSEDPVSSTKPVSSEGSITENKKKAQNSKKAVEKEPRSFSENIIEDSNTLPLLPRGEKSEEKSSTVRKNSLSGSSHSDDLDDEDCINIRTDGELLDTNEEPNAEEASQPSREKENTSKVNNKESDKRVRSVSKSPPRLKEKSHSKVDEKSRKAGDKEVFKKQSPKPAEKVVDAREFINRKKAAKESENKARSKSRERSCSPPRRRKEDERDSSRRVYSNRDGSRRGGKDSEKESSSRRVAREDDARDRRNTRERDSYLGKRKSDERSSRRNDTDRMDSRVNRRRSPSEETSSKRIHLDKPLRNKTEDARTSRIDARLTGSRRETEEGRSGKRGLVSRIVARPEEPEEEVDAPVPSVVKVTPRPNRPAAQGPSSTLILKAISEANRSLANAPPRPDSTQRARKEPALTRTLRNRQIPPEKIAVSITNHLALQNVTELQEEEQMVTTPSVEEQEISLSPRYDETARNKSPSLDPVPEHSQQSEKDIAPQKATSHKKKQTTEQATVLEEVQEPVLELQPSPEVDDQKEEPSDPQFVVTLNGYDPDGLFVGMDVDGEGDEWLRERILTSTPPSQMSPLSQSKHNDSSSLVTVKTPAINHSNLIAVDVKPKATERCKYWPACKLLDKCTFYHPTKLCNMFPNCKFGDTCLYIHPQCKYNALCTRKDCIFAHTTAHTPLQPSAVGPKVKPLYATSALLPCKFYPNCTNANCQFAHPTRACRFGLYCTKKDCSFDHSQVAPTDKLKWTRVSST